VRCLSWSWGCVEIQKASKGHFMGFSSDTTEATFVVSMVLQEIDRAPGRLFS
jgi:hypothetical protein